MRLSYRWIKEFLGTEIGPAELIDKLIMIGHEVEGVIDLGLMGNPVRVARIASVEPHPDADKLSVCQVEDGTGATKQVVCGAPNAREGLLCVLAGVGAELPGGITIKKAKLRGVASEGMLLAADEMGMGADHSGLLELDDDAPAVGEGFDVLFETEITPNRPDCLSVFGLARDLAAALGEKIRADKFRINEGFEMVHDHAKVWIKAPEDCPRYTARMIKDVEIKPSPAWMQRRLMGAGLRPINNVVDATNYVLLEYGHPLHAFDYDRLADHEITVRMARKGEKITLIDETELELRPDEDLLITDGQRPVALAGIMGGMDSGVTGETRNLLLESAYFKPSTIRRSSRHHHVSTDSSYRFERGTDILGLTRSLDRVTQLILDSAGGTCTRGTVDTRFQPYNPPTLMLRPERACRRLGVEINKTVMADMLAALGFDILRADRDMLAIAPPSFRVDVVGEEDLVEEIVRLHGYDKVPATLPYLPAAAEPINPHVAAVRRVQDELVALGFMECVHLSFVSRQQVGELGMDGHDVLPLLNPLSAELAVLRPTLLPSLLRTLLHNQNHGNRRLQLFEVSNIYRPGDLATPFVEKNEVALAWMGPRGEREGWREQDAEPADFFSIKGAVESLFSSLGIPAPELRAEKLPEWLHGGRGATLLVEGQALGHLGELHPALVRSLGFRDRPQLALIDFDKLAALIRNERVFAELPRYPAIERDLAPVLDRAIPAEKVEAEIRQAAGELLESVELFDLFEGEQLGAGKRSLGYRCTYRHAERTLKDEEADAAQQRVVAALEKRLGAVLRA